MAEQLVSSNGENLQGTSENDVLEATGFTNNTLDGLAGNDELIAGSDGTVNGGDGDDILDATAGGGGNTLNGDAGNDDLFGGNVTDNPDTLNGGEGSDRLFAGLGGNSLTGGAGNDQFWIAQEDFPLAPSEISDFTQGEDVIGISLTSAVDVFEDLSLVRINNDADLVIQTSDQTRLAILTNFAEQLVASDFANLEPDAEPPTTNDDEATTAFNQGIAIDVLNNDTDDGQLNPATVTVTTDPSNGTFTIDTNTGEISYTPDDGFTGEDTFAYTVEDAAGNVSQPATVTVTVEEEVDAEAPTTNDDEATTAFNQAVTVDVLDNDTDNVEIDPTTVSVATNPNNGTTEVDANTGEITYTPNDGFSGENTFTYTVEDAAGNVSGAATVTVTVEADEEAPTTSDDEATTAFNQAVTVDVLDNDTDNGEIDPTTVSVATNANNGTTGVDADTGEITYTPNDGFSGEDTFTYTVEDAAGNVSGEAAVTVTVEENTPPEITLNPLSLDEGAAVAIRPDLLEAVDDEQSPEELTYTINTLPTQGRLSLGQTDLAVDDTFTQADINGSQLRYFHDGSDPDDDPNTPDDDFTFTVSDGVVTTDVQTFNINVNPVDDEGLSVVNRSLTPPAELNEPAEVDDNSLLVEGGGLDPSEIQYSVFKEPIFGTLFADANTDGIVDEGEAFNPNDTFTQEDIDQGGIFYTRTEERQAPQDFVLFRFGDTEGLENQVRTLNVPFANIAPELETTNPNIEVGVGAAQAIRSDALLVSDGDNDDSEVGFTVSNFENIDDGFLFLLSPGQAPQIVDSNTTGTELTFSQEALEGGFLYYISTGDAPGNDSFEFSYTDGVAPAQTETFDIAIT